MYNAGITVHAVSLNPCLVYYQGQTYFSGKGLNVARNLKKLGHGNVSVHVLAGGNNGECLGRLLENEFDSVILTEIKDSTIAVDFRNGKSRRRSPINPSVSDEELSLLEDKLKARVSANDAVVIAGSLPSNVPASKYGELVDYFNRQGSITVLDTSDKEALRIGFEASPAIVKPNRDEICGYLNLSDPSDPKLKTELLSLLPEIKTNRKIKSLLVSLDSDGAILFSDSGTYSASPVYRDVISRVASGDSLLAGYLFGYIRDLTDEENLRLAVASASFNMANPFNTNKGVQDMVELEKGVKITRIL